MANEEIQQPKEEQIPVYNLDREIVNIPQTQLTRALRQGYEKASPQEVQKMLHEEKYGSAGQQLVTGLEGAANVLTAGTAPAIEQKLFDVKPEDIMARREANPIAFGAGQLGGTAAASLIPVAGEYLTGARLAETGSAALGLGGTEAGIASTIGSHAVKNAIQTAIFAGQDEVAKMLSKDPNQSMETAMLNIGLNGIFGAGIGAGFGTLSPLWKAASESKVAKVIQNITGKGGGASIPGELDQLIGKMGVDLPPEIRAGLSSDPEVLQMFKTLEQTDTAKSGLEFQETFKNFKQKLGEKVVEAMGKPLGELPGLSEKLSKYESGKSIGEILAKEYEAKIGPVSDSFDKLKAKYGNVELPKSVESTQVTKPKDILDPLTEIRKTTPGITDLVSGKISERAASEGWVVSPSSDIMREVNRVLKELPGLKTVGDLGKYITEIGNNTFDPMNPALSRAGSIMKSILKDAEADVIAGKIGQTEGVQALGEFQSARTAYKAMGDLKETLNDRLHIKGGVSGYAKAIREMSRTDAENLLNRMSGKNDADLLSFLSKNFPETARSVSQHHVDTLLKLAVDKAKPGEVVNAKAIISAVDKMSPEMRKFVLADDVLNRINNVDKILERFEQRPHNFSNTARALDKALEYIPASAMGMAALLIGHNPLVAGLVGALTKYVGTNAPAAVRLALLRTLGEKSPVSGAGFKAMVDFIHATMKGENLLGKASKGVFDASKVILAHNLVPDQKSKDRLDKKITELNEDPNSLFAVGGDVGHYLPDHAAALGSMSARVVSYLNSIKPRPVKGAPLDTESKISAFAKAKYDRALTIAEQPLSIFEDIRKGTLVLDDVVHLRSMYPGLYNRAVNKLHDEMITHISKGNSIPYKTRMSLSLFMGQPLDSTMTPQAIQGAQMGAIPQAQMQQMNLNAATTPKGNLSKLNKLPSMYRTPTQSRELARYK